MTAKVYVDVLAVFSREGELIPTAFGLAAEAVGKEDNYAENTGYVYQYGRSGRGCL